MPNNLKSQFEKQGFLVVRNVLDFNFDLKPVLNDMEFIMNRLIDRFVSKNNKSKVYKYDFWKKYTWIPYFIESAFKFFWYGAYCGGIYTKVFSFFIIIYCFLLQKKI